MAFQVDPRPLGDRGPSRAAAALAGVTVLLASAVGLAALFPAREPSSPSVAEAAASGAVGGSPAAEAPVATRRPGPKGPTEPVTLPAADAIACNGVAPVRCDRLVRAAVALISRGADTAAMVDAWGAIVCGDATDCPPDRLAGSQPLGSAVVTLGSGGLVWVNVIEEPPPAGRPWEPGRTRAWAIRWVS
jgi:hypothetical protein